MQQISPGVTLTHVAIDEVLNLLRTSSTPDRGHHPEPSLATLGSKRSLSTPSAPTLRSTAIVFSTGSLPRGMRAWIDGNWLLVEAGSRSKSNIQ